MIENTFSWADAQRRLRERLNARCIVTYCAKYGINTDALLDSSAACAQASAALGLSKDDVVSGVMREYARRRAPSARVRRNRVRIGLPEVE